MKVALIGYGEVGRRLAEDLAGKAEVVAWDIDPAKRPSFAAASAADAAAGADLIISAVTAANDLAAAQAAAEGVSQGAFYLDLNSCSPSQKREARDVIEAAHGRYVEAAVMSPIDPKRIASPMLLGGAHAVDFLNACGHLGFAGAQAYSTEVGKAAATKLCRSVMIKGVEALLAESLVSARHYGVEDEVLASLSNLLPLPDWRSTARYMISRSLEHGARRAEEMREAARTVDEAGIEPLMSYAIAERQDWAADFSASLGEEDLAAMLDAIIRESQTP